MSFKLLSINMFFRKRRRKNCGTKTLAFFNLNTVVVVVVVVVVVGRPSFRPHAEIFRTVMTHLSRVV